MDLTKIDMMKSESAYYQKIEGNSIQLDMSDFICDVNYCDISEV